MTRKEFLQETLHKQRVQRRKMNEALRNMPYELENKSRTAIDPIMSKAISDSIETDKKIEDAMKERNEAAEKLVKWQESAREGKIEKNPTLKKLHLQESLFESAEIMDQDIYSNLQEIVTKVESAASGKGNDRAPITQEQGEEILDALAKVYIILHDENHNLISDYEYNTARNDIENLKDWEDYGIVDSLSDFEQEIDTEINDLWQTVQEAGLSTPTPPQISHTHFYRSNKSPEAGGYDSGFYTISKDWRYSDEAKEKANNFMRLQMQNHPEELKTVNNAFKKFHINLIDLDKEDSMQWYGHALRELRKDVNRALFNEQRKGYPSWKKSLYCKEILKAIDVLESEMDDIHNSPRIR